jgi:hypothetical protein
VRTLGCSRITASDATRKPGSRRPAREKAWHAQRRRWGRATRMKVGREQIVLSPHRSSSRLVADAASALFGTRPPESFLETSTARKTISRSHRRTRGTLGRGLNPDFARATSCNTRKTGNTPCGATRAPDREDLTTSSPRRFLCWWR